MTNIHCISEEMYYITCYI